MLTVFVTLYVYITLLFVLMFVTTDLVQGTRTPNMLQGKSVLSEREFPAHEHVMCTCFMCVHVCVILSYMLDP